MGPRPGPPAPPPSKVPISKYWWLYVKDREDFWMTSVPSSICFRRSQAPGRTAAKTSATTDRGMEETIMMVVLKSWNIWRGGGNSQGKTQGTQPENPATSDRLL